MHGTGKNSLQKRPTLHLSAFYQPRHLNNSKSLQKKQRQFFSNLSVTINTQIRKIMESAILFLQAPAAASSEKLSITDLVLKGWYIYIPLLIMSVITIYIFVERWLTVAKANKEESNFMTNIKQYINQGKLDAAKNLCVTTNTPVARMIGKGIARIGKPLEDIKSAVENSGKLEISNLEKNTSILAIIASIAPMFGFLGTVIGVITIFHDISNVGKIEIGVVSQGLYIKMISSAAGLVVGMLAYVAYNTLVTRIGRLVNTMESHAVEFVDILDEPMN